eukprot:11733641-Ditylum_brightwellii.AAC.1
MQQSAAVSESHVTRLRNVISLKNNNNQIHDKRSNHHNPNFKPAFEWFEKGEKGRALRTQQSTKQHGKALHHGQCTKEKQG